MGVVGVGVVGSNPSMTSFKPMERVPGGGGGVSSQAATFKTGQVGNKVRTRTQGHLIKLEMGGGGGGGYMQGVCLSGGGFLAACYLEDWPGRQQDEDWDLRPHDKAEVCVFMKERGREGGSEGVCVFMRERERVYVCECVCS